MSRGEIVKAGYLTKSPPEGRLTIAQWQKRWFVLADSHRVYPLASRYVRMEYYQSEEDADKLRNPKGVIKLQTCSKVSNRENMRGFKHVFDVCTSDRTYHLVAEDELDKHSWIDTLNTTLFTASHSHKPPPPTDHHSAQQQNVRPVGLPPPPRSSPDSSNAGKTHGQEYKRPLSLTDDYSSASRQMTRPLPPVPTKTSVNRPLPPTPPDRVSTPTRYKRLSESPSVTPPTSHRLIHQSKSSSAVQEGPDRYQLSSSPPQPVIPDYVNLDGDGTPVQLPHNSRDYENLKDQDYDDTVTTGECVYEKYVPQPGAAPISLPSLAPISRPSAGAKSVGYVNVENSATVSDDYSLLEASAHQPSTASDEYSLLEAVHPHSSAASDGDYSRLEVSGHLDLGLPKKPPLYNGGKDYENLAHVAHPDNGDYSNLQY